MISGKLIFKKRRVTMDVSCVTQNTRIWYATSIIRRGTLELIVRLTRRNNKMLISVNMLEGIKISVTFYLLQTDQSVIKIYRLLTLDVHNISVSIV